MHTVIKIPIDKFSANASTINKLQRINPRIKILPRYIRNGCLTASLLHFSPSEARDIAALAVE